METINRSGFICMTFTVLFLLVSSALADGEWATEGGNIYSTNSGNIGIGTTNPDNAQSWNRVLNLHGVNHAKILVTESNGVKTGIFSHHGYNGKIGTESNHNLTFTAGYWNDVMTLTTAGNVGIGTTAPQSKLAVDGTITAKEIKVESGWSDFVFDEDYDLASLDEVESFIRENKHLPDIPSAGEVAHQGISVSQMMAKQMQKIEELTLYIIEQNRKIKKLEKQMANMIGSDNSD